MRGIRGPDVNPGDFEGVRSTPSPPLTAVAGPGPTLSPPSLCTPPTGSRAFPAPLVHTPVGTGGARAPPRGGKSADCNNTTGAFVL